MNNFKNIPDLSGKVAIVTGANSGTGYGIVYHLAKNGCKVVMAGRNQQKLEDAKAQMLQEVPEADLEIGIVDLMSLSSIKSFCDEMSNRHPKVDFLANNAGGGGSAFAETIDGFEANFFLNYLGHFAITTQLLPVLKDSGRIVNFASIGYKRFLKNDLDVDNLLCTNADDYDQMQEYCKAKLCAILHAVRLQREFEAKGLTAKAFACHPGNARTNLMYADDIAPGMRFMFKYLLAPMMKLFGQSHSLYDGALPAIEALIAHDAQPYKVYAPDSKNEFTGDPIPYEIDDTHYKESDVDALWDKTQELLDIRVAQYV